MRTPLTYLVLAVALSSIVFSVPSSEAQSFLNCSSAQFQQLQHTQQLEREAGVILEAIFKTLETQVSIEHPWITLVQNAQPQAFSLSAGQIVLTSGILQRTTSAAELAFVISHEMAHKLLDHPTRYAALLGSQTEDSTLSGELDADSGANQLLARLNMTNAGAINLLERLRMELEAENPSQGRALKTRISALSSTAN